MTHQTGNQRGFTLIEIAIVLVIIGLLLGGILKGQELITSARVRNLISQQDGIKAAYYGFQDRYRALPGDYATAATNLAGSTAATNGNGNGQIEAPNSGTNESILVWDHLSRAGFLNGNFAYVAGDAVKDSNTPRNPYGQYFQLVFDANFFALNSSGVMAAAGTARHNLKTGNLVPVEIIAEVDRKTDDGNGGSGSIVFSKYTAGGTAPADPAATASCIKTDGAWLLQGGSDPNCGAATLL